MDLDLGSFKRLSKFFVENSERMPLKEGMI